MDLLINRVKRSEIKPGDHIYTYRAVFANSQHGIFVGENKVVHFTPSFYKSPLPCSSNPKCGFRQPDSGVVRSCLDCFLENGSLYRFKYEVSLVVFLAHARDGTCSIAKSDPPEEVIHRAVYLLGSGFGKYDVLQNNSVDFALYCKTSLRVVDKENNDIGSINGQYLQWLPPLFLFVTKRPMTSVYMAIFSSILEAGKYCMKRYKTDIGVRADVMRVAVEDLVMTTRPVPMNSESIPILDETNFSDWSEQVQFYLGIRDLDLAFRIEKPPAITDSSNAEEKAIYNSWERSNRLSMMLMKMNIANNIKSTLLECDSAKEFFKIVEERFRSVDKCLTRTLMAELITMKFDDTQGMHEHIIGVTNLITKLKALGINLDELFVVQFIFNSLPLQYESFQIQYNTIKDKWNVDELASMLVQEEARLKQQEHHSVEDDSEAVAVMHSVSISILDGTNFSDWSEQVQLYLGIWDLDLALKTEKPPTITYSSNAKEKAIYNSWERSNRLSIMFMQMSIANNIKSILPKCDNAKEFFKIMEERFRLVDKYLTGILMAELTTMKFDDTWGMHEHIIEMTNLFTTLKALGMNLNDLFLVQFIFNSLPLEYESFQIHYNIIKDKWNVGELTGMLVQEEARLKQQGHHSVHLFKSRSQKDRATLN